ncbi:hypothetical protein CC1G_15512 [Coprinopsis cinerea okayama7|uniref:Uncharacterized protein n=1 Tax=Coprinopsis cinerea (strain Okayama-7 / 130 / ATCC MYA-4618 / FGSC 9003) TaxID=240176 RepID=D6RN93_COPC7|nr:hypothetical protein CC1G_15512 [Coprinopsis cinerea okayama7\|eukprot:XP_002910971.1 hypothetical protein CC1G_15512 [Coprinopsis cinerea okayama7\
MDFPIKKSLKDRLKSPPPAKLSLGKDTDDKSDFKVDMEIEDTAMDLDTGHIDKQRSLYFD